MPKEYKLTTIRDIMEKVPASRISDCCRELGELLQSAKAMSLLIRETTQALMDADNVGEELPQTLFRFPDEVVWVDDGKGHIQSNFQMTEEHTLSVSLEREPDLINNPPFATDPED